MKVLVSAFSCCPGRGSEPGIGWNWTEQISGRHEVWLLTSDEFENEVAARGSHRIHPVFIPSFLFWQKLRNLPLPGMDWLYYYYWQWKAYRRARRLHAEIQFDLAHHVTFGSWRAPSFICRLGVPFIWGPIGGGETLPKAFWPELDWKGRLFERIRHWFQTISKLDPFVQMTIRRASLILAANRDTAAFLPDAAQKKVLLMPNAGISESDIGKTLESTSASREKQLEILFAGMLEPRKGVSFLIRAFQRLLETVPHSRLTIAGAGPELERLQQLVQALAITDSIEFTGALPRERLLYRMSAMDIFVLPSLRDSGGFVLLEAMLAQKPVICIDLGGPGEIVGLECGIKIEPHHPDQVIRDLTAAMASLAKDDELRARLGAKGRERALQRFQWNQKGALLLDYYDSLHQKGVAQPVNV